MKKTKLKSGQKNQQMLHQKGYVMINNDVKGCLPSLANREMKINAMITTYHNGLNKRY